MPLSFFSDSVTVVRPTVVVINGAETFAWANARETVLHNVQVTAQATSRGFDGRTLQISERYTLRANYDADIQAGDHVRWRGETYEIDGDVFHTKSPSGRVSSTRCALVKWSG